MATTKNVNLAETISDKELCDRYMKVSTPMVNDVLRAMGMLYQTLPNNILPLREHMKVAGRAFTIKGSKNLDITNAVWYNSVQGGFNATLKGYWF